MSTLLQRYLSLRSYALLLPQRLVFSLARTIGIDIDAPGFRFMIGTSSASILCLEMGVIVQVHWCQRVPRKV